MTPNKRKQELRVVKPIKSGEVMRPTENMASFSATSVFSQEHMASFSAAVFSHAELAKNPGFDFKGEVCDDASMAEAPSSLRKRKAASAVSLVSLDRSIEEESILARGPKEISFLSGCKDSTGVMLLSFPMKLHWMIYECELAHQAKQKSTKETNEDKKLKPKAVIARDVICDDKTIIGWLPSGTAFKIFDQDQFVKEIMPSYFAGTFKDFQRDLDLWGFTDMPSVRGPPTRRLHLISHPNFVRDQPSRCRAMRFGGILSKAQENRNRIGNQTIL